MSATYVWDGEQVIIVDRVLGKRSTEDMGLTEHLMVNPQANVLSGCRYGYYSYTGWVPRSVKELPKEFRTQLLLLGVS